MCMKKVKNREHEGNEALGVPLFRYADRFCVELSQETFAFGHACSWDARSTLSMEYYWECLGR
jgi:hypothetical protein